MEEYTPREPFGFAMDVIISTRRPMTVIFLL